MPRLNVVKPGLLTAIQDAGRRGFEDLGIIWCKSPHKPSAKKICLHRRAEQGGAKSRFAKFWSIPCTTLSNSPSTERRKSLDHVESVLFPRT